MGAPLGLDALTMARTAERDCDAAEQLFARDLLPQAVFSLQQSAEKAFKAFILVLDPAYTPEDLKKLRHDPLAFSVKLARKVEAAENKQTKMVRRNPALAKHPLMQRPPGWTPMSDALKRLQRDLDHNSSPSALSQADVDYKLAHAIEVEDDWKRPAEEAMRVWAHEHQADDRQALLDGASPREPLRLDAARTLMMASLNVGRLIVRLDAICYIMRRHAEAPRYGVGGTPPERFYSKKHPVVHRLPDLLAYQRETLRILVDEINYRAAADSGPPTSPTAHT